MASQSEKSALFLRISSFYYLPFSALFLHNLINWSVVHLLEVSTYLSFIHSINIYKYLIWFLWGDFRKRNHPLPLSWFLIAVSGLWHVHCFFTYRGIFFCLCSLFTLSSSLYLRLNFSLPCSSKKNENTAFGVQDDSILRYLI